MQCDHIGARHASFSANYPLWLIVRHFLNADLSRELFVATVDAVSNGTVALHDLVEEAIWHGDGAISSWTVRPKAQEAVLARYLVRLLQSWIWQGDGQPGVFNDSEDGPYAKAIAQVDAAFRLSSVDLNVLRDFIAVAGAELVGVDPYIEAALAIVIAVENDHSINANDLSSILCKSAGPVLGGLLVKHLGDLCVDDDHWDLAAKFYQASYDTLAKADGEEWSVLIATMRAICAQSLATTAVMLDGPAAALGMLEKLVSNTDVQGPSWAIVAMNATPDIMRANSSLRVFSQSDRRGATLFSPQIIDQHDLQSALTNSISGRYRDAHRFFWAVLRRQIALGSASYSGNTKAHFGKSIIDDLIAQLDKDRNPHSFRMGVRLLVESQDVDIIKQISWTAPLISAYLSEETLTDVEGRAKRAPGRARQREHVIVQLFSSWLTVCPLERIDLARRMIVFIARMAIENRRTFNSLDNVGGDALAALRTLAKERPEFRIIEPFIVSRAVLANLESQDVISMQEAIETAHLYGADFEENVLRELTENVISKAHSLTPGNTFWNLARAAIVFLDSNPVMELAKKETEFGRKVVGELIRLGLETSSDQEVIMYLLRNLPPDLLQGQVDAQKLDDVVAGIRKQALQTNSTGASEGIRALLVSPAVAKMDGLRDAIEGLKRILLSVATTNPSLSFAESFNSLLYMGTCRGEIAEALNLTDADVRTLVDPLFDPLLEMWRVAATRPEIFNGFSLPPRNVPNSTVVHNWTFASSAFAHSLGRLPELTEAMSEAAKNPLLHKPISVARAIRSEADGANILNLDAIRTDTKEAFYAVLGQRLALLNEIQDDQPDDIVHAIFDQCMRYGPDGMDAGLFVIARRIKASFDLSSHPAKAYRERLLANRQLRISLAPLFDRINGPDASMSFDE